MSIYRRTEASAYLCLLPTEVDVEEYSVSRKSDASAHDIICLLTARWFLPARRQVPGYRLHSTAPAFQDMLDVENDIGGGAVTGHLAMLGRRSWREAVRLPGLFDLIMSETFACSPRRAPTGRKHESYTWKRCADRQHQPAE